MRLGTENDCLKDQRVRCQKAGLTVAVTYAFRYFLCQISVAQIWSFGPHDYQGSHTVLVMIKSNGVVLGVREPRSSYGSQDILHSVNQF